MKRAFLAALLASVALPCLAAEITVTGSTVIVAGMLEQGDDFNLQKVVEPYHGPLTVVLHSLGGMLTPVTGSADGEIAGPYQSSPVATISLRFGRIAGRRSNWAADSLSAIAAGLGGCR